MTPIYIDSKGTILVQFYNSKTRETEYKTAYFIQYTTATDRPHRIEFEYEGRIYSGITAAAPECVLFPIADYFALTETKEGVNILVKYGSQYGMYDNPELIKEYPHRPTLSEIKHEININDWARWNTELIKDSEPVEVGESVYYHMLECLPPRNWKGSYFEVGEPHHHENGKAIHRAFWEDNGKFYTGYPK